MLRFIFYIFVYVHVFVFAICLRIYSSLNLYATHSGNFWVLIHDSLHPLIVLGLIWLIVLFQFLQQKMTPKNWVFCGSPFVLPAGENTVFLIPLLKARKMTGKMNQPHLTILFFKLGVVKNHQLGIDPFSWINFLVFGWLLYFVSDRFWKTI